MLHRLNYDTNYIPVTPEPTIHSTEHACMNILSSPSLSSAAAATVSTPTTTITAACVKQHSPLATDSTHTMTLPANYSKYKNNKKKLSHKTERSDPHDCGKSKNAMWVNLDASRETDQANSVVISRGLGPRILSTSGGSVRDSSLHTAVRPGDLRNQVSSVSDTAACRWWHRRANSESARACLMGSKTRPGPILVNFRYLFVPLGRV